MNINEKMCTYNIASGQLQFSFVAVGKHCISAASLQTQLHYDIQH